MVEIKISDGSDPLGPTFLDDKKRMVFKEFQSELGTHLNQGEVQKLVKAGLLNEFSMKKVNAKMSRLESSVVDYSFSNIPLAGVQNFLPGELPQYTRFRIGKMWLDMNMSLRRNNLCVFDAHLGNIGFLGMGRPVWIDIGSIQQIETGFEGFREYGDFFERPIIALMKYPGLESFVRAGLNQGLGLTRMAYRHLSKIPVLKFKGWGFWSGVLAIAHRWDFWAPKRLMRTSALCYLYLRLLGIKLEYWVRCLPNRLAEPKKHYPNLDQVRRLVSKLKPSSVNVIADLNEKDLLQLQIPYTDHLFLSPYDWQVSRWARRIDQTQNASPTRGKFIGLVRDLPHHNTPADVTVLLGFESEIFLMHKWNFETLSEHLSHISRFGVILRFNPNLKLRSRVLTPSLPEWYILDGLTSSLKKHFSEVTVLEGANASEPLLYCSK